MKNKKPTSQNNETLHLLKKKASPLIYPPPEWEKKVMDKIRQQSKDKTTHESNPGLIWYTFSSAAIFLLSIQITQHLQNSPSPDFYYTSLFFDIFTMT